MLVILMRLNKALLDEDLHRRLVGTVATLQDEISYIHVSIIDAEVQARPFLPENALEKI
jgi:hypothetical protein